MEKLYCEAKSPLYPEIYLICSLVDVFIDNILSSNKAEGSSCHSICLNCISDNTKPIGYKRLQISNLNRKLVNFYEYKKE